MWEQPAAKHCLPCHGGFTLSGERWLGSTLQPDGENKVPGCGGITSPASYLIQAAAPSQLWHWNASPPYSSETLPASLGSPNRFPCSLRAAYFHTHFHTISFLKNTILYPAYVLTLSLSVLMIHMLKNLHRSRRFGPNATSRFSVRADGRLYLRVETAAWTCSCHSSFDAVQFRCFDQVYAQQVFTQVHRCGGMTASQRHEPQIWKSSLQQQVHNRLDQKTWRPQEQYKM